MRKCGASFIADANSAAALSASTYRSMGITKLMTPFTVMLVQLTRGKRKIGAYSREMQALTQTENNPIDGVYMRKGGICVLVSCW